MNKAVYHHLLITFGRRPGVWVGLVCGLIRTLLLRVWSAVLIAQTASSIAAGNFDDAKRAVILICAANIVASILGSFGDLIAIRSENTVYHGLLATYYRKLVGKDMSFYRDHQAGYLAGAFRQYLDGSMAMVRLFRVQIAWTLISLTAPALVLLHANIAIGLAAVGVVAVQIVYVLWSSSKANHYRQLSHEIYRKVSGEAADAITNIVAFKSAGTEHEAFAKMDNLANQEIKTFWQRRKTTILLDFPRSLATAFGVTAVLWVALSGAEHNGPESVGLVVLTFTYMFQIIRNVHDLPSLIIEHDDLVTKIYPALDYLSDAHEAIVDPPTPKKLIVDSGVIGINHIDFSYPGHNNQGTRIPVFTDLDIQIAGGEQVGIVGLSGAGKSTLASLLMRFDDVEGGSITYDGFDIRDVRQSELRQKIAYVPQEPLLFHSTVRENIAYFNAHATQADIERAAKAAHAHDFIAKLPGGYDTVVGERGIKLSGGQKQRVVIARAILKNAPVMIFDEATSALDSESEQIIQRALPDIIGKHTAIIIAHRLSTVAGLDRIIVMHNGQVVENGSHEALLAQRGRYFSLWQKQTAA